MRANISKNSLNCWISPPPADCRSPGKGTSLPLPRRNGKSLPQDAASGSRYARRHLTQLFHQPALRLQPLPPTQEGICGPHEHPGRNQYNEGTPANQPTNPPLPLPKTCGSFKLMIELVLLLAGGFCKLTPCVASVEKEEPVHCVRHDLTSSFNTKCH